MSSIINILGIVDVERVLRDHPPNGSQPVPLKNSGKGYAFLLTEWDDTDQYRGTNIFYKVPEQDQEEGGYSLNVKAETGDTVRWRLISLTSPFRYQCYLYNLQPIGGWDNITPPQPKTNAVTHAALALHASIPAKVIAAQNNDYWWESTVTNSNRQPYNIYFFIVDNSGTVRRPYFFDPYIT